MIGDVPKNMTHLFAPLDLTVNKSMKQLEQREFSEYYSKAIGSHLKSHPNGRIEDFKVDIKLSTIKPLHAKTMTKVYNFFKSSRGKEIIQSGWRASGITGSLQDARDGNLANILLDPFKSMSIF